MKLLILYFEHNPKIQDKIQWSGDIMQNSTKNFIYGYLPNHDYIYWYIIDIRNFSGFIFKQKEICWRGINTVKELCRFIRMFRNEFIGSPYKQLNQFYCDCDEEDED